MSNINKKGFLIFDFVLVVLSGIYILGLNTWFRPCDSELFACSSTSKVLMLFAILICTLSVLHLIPSKMFKAGIDISMIGILSLIAFLPGNELPLCALKTMRCRSYMQPWSFAFCACIAVICLIDLAICVVNTIREVKK